MRLAVVLWVVVLVAAGCSAPKEAGGSTTSPPATTTTGAPATPTGTSPAQGSYKLTKVVDGLVRPLYVTHAGDGSGRVFIVEQRGVVHVLKNGLLLPTPFLDISALVTTQGNEQGLLGLAFYPDYATSGRFIVDYSRSASGTENGDTVVARYKVTSNPDVADPASAEVLLTIDQPQSNHNGGLVKFGPDGMLYIASGDGGGADDDDAGHDPVQGNGQSLETLLGKLLRIDVSGEGPYKIPADNPSLGANAKKEIWAYGLRNPWRFSFDRATGDLFIADVGQLLWEEIDYQPKASKGGENYGWRVWEGSHLWRPGTALVGDTKPVAEYPHGTGHCSITGGYVYRGPKVPALQGFYLVGDYCTGQLWTLVKQNAEWRLAELQDTPYLISSFGEDEAGELYLTHHATTDGAVYRFDPVS
ncbi:MAG: PQQ-dependent sugar dehydrogenase [Euryarchaeota archaeon]|nr:PQQ-dependent sugar dehydrogenase [Euryarchaeota archaeon]